MHTPSSILEISYMYVPQYSEYSTTGSTLSTYHGTSTVQHKYSHFQLYRGNTHDEQHIYQYNRGAIMSIIAEMAWTTSRPCSYKEYYSTCMTIDLTIGCLCISAYMYICFTDSITQYAYILHVSSHIRYIIYVYGWISMDQFPVAIPGTSTTVRQTPAVLVLYWSTRSTVYWSIQFCGLNKKLLANNGDGRPCSMLVMLPY